MRQTRPISRIVAAHRARRWIAQIASADPRTSSMQSLGELLFRRMAKGRVGPIDPDRNEVAKLPAPAQFVELPREELLSLCNDIVLSQPVVVGHVIPSSRRWSALFGAIAASYSREGDLSMVAALVRAAARLNLHDDWLVSAEDFLLHQQQPDGSFEWSGVGFISRNASTSHDVRYATAALQLATEVLWTLTETRALQRRLIDAAR